MSQKNAVFEAVITALRIAKIPFTPGADEASKLLTQPIRTKVAELVIKDFQSGKIKLENPVDDNQLRLYVSNLISNWLRKDTRLNGGNTTPKTANSDPQLKALRRLLASTSDQSARKEVNSFIAKRIVELGQ